MAIVMLWSMNENFKSEDDVGETLFNPELSVDVATRGQSATLLFIITC